MWLSKLIPFVSWYNGVNALNSISHIFQSPSDITSTYIGFIECFLQC